MKLWQGMAAALLLGVSGCQTTAPDQNAVAARETAEAPAPEVIAEAARLFDAMAQNYPALNVTVRHHGSIVWEREGGVQRASGDGVATDYNFYSTAKMLTGLAFARLEQERGLDLSQSIRAIDPELPAQFQPVTIRHLLTHTSGVHHYQGDADWAAFSARRCATPADAIGHFIADPLAAQPGERLIYSSYAFVLLSHLLVKTTGAATYDEAMRAVLGDAYQMRSDREGADKGTPYARSDAGFTPLPTLSAECKFGAGGLLASSRDLAAFGEALYQGDIVDLDRVPQLFTPGQTGGQPNPFVYGSVVRIENGVHVVGHSGGSPGGKSYLEVWIEPEVAVGITGNVEGEQLGPLAAALARLFAGMPAAE